MTATNKISAIKLWNPKSFIIFSLFFSFVPAGIMSALNYGRYGNKKRKWVILISTILGFVTLITLASLLPVDAPYIFLAINIGVGVFLSINQRTLYKDHIENGGKKASYILPIIIGIIIFSLAAASIMYTINIPKNALDYGENHLFYTNNITQLQAKELGDYFNREGYFTSNSKIDVKIDKQNDTYVLSLVAEGDYQNNQNYVGPMRALSKELSQNVFKNSKVRIDLCDDRFKVLKSINTD
ncbi:MULTISPECIES: hypothetical protein [unclassified Clostridium]|uniref:hypothetical protein n=1 Tax=unclassified Clostridium TaxID=2614128 RepID=UPI0002986233|nr:MULTISPECIES: hypothetical protein [unclassified Clostridium]EKQ51563.1 MAG: hypothetical protein A370_04741 [Clostridium sp. Maddingley MBC34-26]